MSSLVPRKSVGSWQGWEHIMVLMINKLIQKQTRCATATISTTATTVTRYLWKISIIGLSPIFHLRWHLTTILCQTIAPFNFVTFDDNYVSNNFPLIISPQVTFDDNYCDENLPDHYKAIDTRCKKDEGTQKWNLKSFFSKEKSKRNRMIWKCSPSK